MKHFFHYVLLLSLRYMEILDACPLCDYTEFELFVEANDYLVSKRDFSVVKCRNCGFLFTNPRPSDNVLGEFYLSDDYISHTDSKQSFLDRIYHVVRKIMLKKKISHINSQLHKPKKPIKLLDYGCGTGQFLDYAKNKGFTTFGIEPDGNARKLAISRGLKVNSALDSDFFRDNKSFDVITLWHVFEHVPNPVSVIKDLDGLLAENGLIVVAIPEYRSYDASFYKSSWAAWDVPRHLNHFNENTLLRLFSKQGFKIVKKFPLFFDAFYVSLLSEKTKSTGAFGYLRAFLIGLISNLFALFGIQPYSSQVYFFRRN